MATYQTLVDAVNQIEHDQSLFESELGTELQGALHSELVELGGKMTKKFKQFLDMGKFFAEQQQPDVLSKMLQAIQEYESLLMPPKVCWGYCPCLKPARFGPEYERQYLLARSKVVAATFLIDAILIEHKAEKINMDSMHFADYANKMNAIFNTLSNISTKGNENAREIAKNELLGAFEQVTKFMKSFEEETTDFRSECRRRLASTNELLTSRPTTEGATITRRILVKAQSSLQEIMNSAAGVSMSRSKEAINELEKLNRSLKDARTIQVNEFNALENRMHASNIIDALFRLREDMEVVHSDANSKIRDSLKRWNTVKSQSNPRPVAEYTEETIVSDLSASVSMSNVSNMGNNLVNNINPGLVVGAGGQKILSDVGRELKGVGKDLKDLRKLPQAGGKAALDAVRMTSGFVASGVKKSRDVVLNSANGGSGGGTNSNMNTPSSTPMKTSQHRPASANGNNSSSGIMGFFE